MSYMCTSSGRYMYMYMLIDIVIPTFSGMHMLQWTCIYTDLQCADDLRLHLYTTGIVGEVEDAEDGEKDYYLWTHKKLDIGYNGDKVSVCEAHMHVRM